jgi:hypothetical protein
VVGPRSIVLGVESGVAIVSVVASSAVALAAVAAQVWQGRLNRQNEQRAWLRDRRANTYIAMFRLFEKTPDDVTQDEWEMLMATVRVFASTTMADLFGEWGDAARLTWSEDESAQARERAYERAESAQHRMVRQVITEVQGARASGTPS